MSGVTIDNQDGVLSIMLNRPEKLNALNADMLEQISEALVQVRMPESGIGAILLTGAGRSFCSGADRSAFAQLTTEQQISRHAHTLKSVLLGLAESSVPVIVAVQGYALGAGCGLVTASTITIASEGAQFGYPELATGVMPALVAPVLARVVGPRRAKAMILTSQRLTAIQAMAAGIVTDVCKEDPRPIAQQLAALIARQSEGAVASILDLVDGVEQFGLAHQLEEAARVNIRDRLSRL